MGEIPIFFFFFLNDSLKYYKREYGINTMLGRGGQAGYEAQEHMCYKESPCLVLSWRLIDSKSSSAEAFPQLPWCRGFLRIFHGTV